MEDKKLKDIDEIVIDINNANKSQKYKNNSGLFQIEAFNNVVEILEDYGFDEEQSDNITNCRVHNTIFIDGDRGVGKTAFMINIEDVYKKEQKKNKFLFFNPVDPTLLEHTEKFLSVILAKIIEKVNDDIKSNIISNDNLENYYKKLEKLSISLSAIKTLPDDIGIDEIASNKSSLKLEQNAHEFFKEVSSIYKVKALVMLIDDIDMAFDKGFDVLEVVRKYLASPYLIPIVAGDMKLYKEIIETKFIENIKYHQDVVIFKNLSALTNKENDRKFDIKKELLDDLVEQYIHKLFPNENHIELSDIYKVVRDYYVTIKIDDLKVSYNDIKDFEIRFLNFGINQVDFTFRVFTNNTRDLIQYIYSKRKIYKDFFGTLPSYQFKKVKDILYDIKEVSKKFDTHILTKLQSSLYKKSFEKTALFYKFSKDRKKQELSKLTKNDYEAYENNEYNPYKAFTNDIFSSFMKLKLDNAQNSFALQREKLSNIIKKEDDHFNDIYNYIMDLFIFNDYYSSYQQRSYIYVGKFLESIIFSLGKINNNEIVSNDDIKEVHNFINNKLNEKIDKDENFWFNLNAEIYSILYDGDDKSIGVENKKLADNIKSTFTKIEVCSKASQTLKDITIKIPFGSDVSKNKSRFIDDNENEEVEEYFFNLDYNLDDYIKYLQIWQKVFLKNVRLNSISLYEITYKFLRNIEKLKNKYDLKHEDPIVFLRRVTIILINSFAFFENKDKNISSTNIAMSKNFDLAGTLEKSPASMKNILPMLKEQNSITRALFFHPLISHLLFTDESKDKDGFTSKLFELAWQGKKSILKEPKKIKNNNITINTLNNIYIKYFNKSVLRDKFKKNEKEIYQAYVSYFTTINEKLREANSEVLSKFSSAPKYNEVLSNMSLNYHDENIIKLINEYKSFLSK